MLHLLVSTSASWFANLDLQEEEHPSTVRPDILSMSSSYLHALSAN